MTAEQRRATGEAPFCDCPLHVHNARADLQWASFAATYATKDGHECLGALLRATVIWTLLFGWGEA